MSKALSVDLRLRVLAAVAAGLTHRQAAERFGVGAAPASAVGANWNASRAILSRRRWAGTGVRDGSRRMARRSWPCWRRPPISRWRNCVASWPRRVWSSATARSAASSSATRSRAKKDRARHRTRPSRHSEATRAVVRGSDRPRPGAAGLYRRDLGFDQHGAPLRALPARRAAQGRHPAWALERPQPSSAPSPRAASSHRG